MTWTDELMNDPENDSKLYIELLEDDEYRGRIERRDGVLILRIYVGNLAIPAHWLQNVLSSAEDDLND